MEKAKYFFLGTATGLLFAAASILKVSIDSIDEAEEAENKSARFIITPA
jgi:hypothetical protein